MIPTHTLHDLFADHEDTEHGFCERYHSHLGLHVEKKHTHCEILKTNTPVYDQPSFIAFQKAETILFALLVTSTSEKPTQQNFFSLPVRGPPAV